MSGRRLVAALAAGAALLGTAGCERPFPSVTLAAGDRVVRSAATTWSFEGAQPVNRQVERQVLEVQPGERLHVDVDKALVERKWFVEFEVPGSQPGRAELQDDHYFFIELGDAVPDRFVLRVKALDGTEAVDNVTGQWEFEVRKKS